MSILSVKTLIIRGRRHSQDGLLPCGQDHGVQDSSEDQLDGVVMSLLDLEKFFTEYFCFFLNPSFIFIFDLVHSEELVCQALEGVQILDLSIPLEVVARSALFYIMGVQALREQM
jgi:hypothetical protein